MKPYGGIFKQTSWYKNVSATKLSLLNLKFEECIVTIVQSILHIFGPSFIKKSGHDPLWRGAFPLTCKNAAEKKKIRKFAMIFAVAASLR